MKRVLSAISKIWFPALVVGIVAVQSFASDFSRAMASRGAEASRDTVIYSNNIFTKFRSEYERAREDSMSFELMSGDSNEVVITARDTMKVPDSLRFTDPFRYKYYVAIKDSLTHIIVRDSLKNAGDSIDWPKLDSLYKIDSTETAIRKFNEWYASLDKAARKKYDFEQKMKARQVMIDSILNAKDSLLAIRDSIRENTPRILETFAVPDSLYYKRILTWNKGSYFNDIHLQKLDTSYNYRFNDYPFYREDVNVSYLGIVGSATQYYDFFKRKSAEGVTFYTPYECYSYNPYSLPFYNTKTPYTELAYWGTLFANEERAENNLHIMTTQNILPSWNFTLEYDRFGANGMLENERVDNRTFAASTNFTGKKYLAHAGYIYNKMDKGENGGIVDQFLDQGHHGRLQGNRREAEGRLDIDKEEHSIPRPDIQDSVHLHTQAAGKEGPQKGTDVQGQRDGYRRQHRHHQDGGVASGQGGRARRGFGERHAGHRPHNRVYRTFERILHIPQDIQGQNQC